MTRTNYLGNNGAKLTIDSKKEQCKVFQDFVDAKSWTVLLRNVTIPSKYCFKPKRFEFNLGLEFCLTIKTLIEGKKMFRSKIGHERFVAWGA